MLGKEVKNLLSTLFHVLCLFLLFLGTIVFLSLISAVLF
jgi:hypothetical protein